MSAGTARPLGHAWASPRRAQRAELYRLDPPRGDVEFVVVSSITDPHLEVLVFPARDDGSLVTLRELTGIKKTTDHAEVLRLLGYEIQEQADGPGRLITGEGR